MTFENVMHSTTVRNLILWAVWVTAITVTAGLPRGTPPNSIEPWIGPIPFSLAWILLLYIVGIVLLYLSYLETGEIYGLKEDSIVSGDE